MPISPLSDLNAGSRHWTIQVYVSRLWQDRGATDDGPIKHTDMVLLDTQGNHMYAEIAEGFVDQFIDTVSEGKVYEIRRFVVTPKKFTYRPVEAQYMIRIGKYASVLEMNDSIMDYPLCTYALTPLDELPRPADMPARFTDVLAIITGISPATQFHSAYRATPSTKRVIHLSDMNGFKVDLILWGQRALDFDGDGLLQTAEKKPIVAIFVGTLVKPYEGQRGLSGSAPCRWYINEDIPEINELHARLKDNIPVVQNILLPGQSAAEISAQVDLESKTVSELLELNIWDHDKTKFFCTVVITKLSPAQRWWFSSCTTCHKTTLPFGSGFRCSDAACVGKSAMPRYRICYVGSDGIGEVELVFFDRVDKEIVGKSLMSLLRTGHSHSTPMDEVIEAARMDQSTPRELAAVISKKYRFVVSVTTKSFDAGSDKPSYQVHRIDESYGKQPHSSTLRRTTGLALASNSKSEDCGLSPSGTALANLAALSQTTASDIVTTSAEAPATSEGASNMTLSQMTLLKSPPSVKKPTGLRMKETTDSVAKRPLFQHSSPQAMTGEMFPQAVTDELSQPVDATGEMSLPVDAKDDATLLDEPVQQLAVSPTAAEEVQEEILSQSTPEKRRRNQSAKGQAVTDNKKKKPA